MGCIVSWITTWKKASSFERSGLNLRRRLAKSMELGPSWGAVSHSVTQRISQYFMEPGGAIPCWQEPATGPESDWYVHNTPSYFYKIHFNIILPPMSGSSWWPLSFWFLHQNPVCIPLLYHALYMLCLSDPPWLHFSNYIWRRVQVMKLLIIRIISSLFGPNIHFSTLFSNTLSRELGYPHFIK
jgi:hypothetical protein